MNKEAIFAYNPLLVHFLIWFLMTLVTYGTAVPAGLFLPGILIGCTLGRILTLFISTTFETTVQPATCISAVPNALHVRLFFLRSYRASRRCR